MKRAALVALALAAAACGREGEAPAAPEPAAAERRAPKPPEAERKPGPKAMTGERYAASNILVAWKGAKRAAPGVTRTEEEARALAGDLYRQIREGADFGALADRNSDGPERGHGGRLGVFGAGGNALPEIERAVAGLAVGEVAAPVRSPFGYHVIRRDEIEEVYLAEIVVAFAGAGGAPAGVARTREEAAARAREAREALSVPGAKFADVAAKYSDAPSRARGGIVGRVSRGLLPPALDAAAFALEAGRISDPVEMPAGFTILRRLPETQVRHVLIAYKGALRAPAEVTRSKEEAAALIAEIAAKMERGDDFGQLARSYSDCPSKVRGGFLGTVAQGTMTERFEAALTSVGPGERTGVVETEFGFHVMERLR